MSEYNFTKLHSDFINYLDTALNSIKDTAPLIHCITNPISCNDCANAVLALGGSPIMAEHPMEVKKITEKAAALCLNTAAITDVRMESIKISARAACDSHIPFTLDAVGVNCSELRYKYVNKLLEDIKPTVVKGNLAEIKKLAHLKAQYTGVDSAEKIENENELLNAVDIVKKLSREINCIIAATGRHDIISDGFTTAVVSNGSQFLPRITACYSGTRGGNSDSNTPAPSLGANIFRVILGAVILGVCGELAEIKSLKSGVFCGLGTFHINLLNSLSTITSDDIKERVQLRFL